MISTCSRVSTAQRPAKTLKFILSKSDAIIIKITGSTIFIMSTQEHDIPAKHERLVRPEENYDIAHHLDGMVSPTR